MSYQLALEAAGCEVLDFVEFGCYQGEWLALIRKDGVLGVCEGSYGSCSGCDSFEAEFGWVNEQSPDYQERLAAFGESYLPANSLEEMIAKLQKDVENYDWDDDYKSMLQTVREWQKKYIEGKRRMRVGEGEKVVNYFGTQVIVPAWVNWLAVDKCEELNAYENEPYVDKSDDCDRWYEDTGKSIFIGEFPFEEGRWVNSLVNVSSEA